MDSITVELGERSYPIHIGTGLLARLDELKGPLKGRQIALITNPTIDGLYGDAVRAALAEHQVDVFCMPDGEEHKSLETYGQLMDFLLAQRHNRTTCVVALGGGVVGDLAGFAAATFQRGVDFVQVPTTLLAQVDSSVGGKTAVNHPAGKNLIGAFYQPNSVIIDTDVLASLPAREYAAGLAEIVKYGVIDDADLFSYLEQNAAAINQRDGQALSYLIRRSCEIKAKVVALDEREGGVRAILNFGHTFGHAIEKLLGYGQLLHGEAVAVGMLMAVRFSQHLGLVDEALVDRLRSLLSNLRLPIELPAKLAADDMLSAMGMDKKAVDGEIRFVITHGLGEVVVTSDYDPDALLQTLAEFCHPTT